MQNEIPETATAEEIGTILGVSARRVRQLASEHSISAVTRGQYPFQSVVQAYLKRLATGRLTASEREQRDVLTNARARQIEARTARQAGELVPAEEARAFVHAVVAALLSGLDDLPDRIAKNGAERVRVKGIVDRIRADMDSLMAEQFGR